MNKITFTGRLAADAELRFTPQGHQVCSFRVASDVGFGQHKTTNWFSCQVWGKRGESVVPYLTKGQQVTVFGTLQMREWTNKEGVKSLSPDVRVDDVDLQGGKREGAAQPAAPSYQPAAQPDADFAGDDIPF